jgi:hypothetical protein
MVIASLELGPDSMDIHLRRKLDATRDNFVLAVDPDDDTGANIIKITRFEERGDTEAPFVVQGEEAARIEELATVLRRECAALIARKTRLLSAQLDGHDVFERNLVSVLLQRISDRLAPTAFEVSRRSPNPNELSLKYEREDGRREELYLRKAELLQMVASLPPEALRMYQHLAFLPLPNPRPELQIVKDDEPIPTHGRDVVTSAPRKSELPARPSALPPPKRRL